MQFESPAALLLLLPILWNLWRVVHSENTHAILFSSLTPVRRAGRTWRGHLAWLPLALRTAALCALVIGLARPRREQTEVTQTSKGIAIEMLIDISSSMDIATDFKSDTGSRLDIAKRVAREFVLGDGKDLDGRPNDLIGLVTFARYADTVCPLTMGHDALVYFIDNLEVEERANEDGTAFGDAAALAAARMVTLQSMLAEEGREEYQVDSKIIILLTDGENNCGRHLPLYAANLAAKWDIRIYTISLGEPLKSRMVNADGDPTAVAQNLSETENLLFQMADMTGGIFRTAYDLDSLHAVYREIDQLEKSEIKSMTYTQYQEFFQPFAVLAIACMLLDAGLGATLLRRTP